ncbi:MAG: alpha-glucan family phosphorylase [Planctomycetes bacterium]|nr:alpha-glucan family phosphorylase [Planctomycetota bacterium]
MKRASTVFEVSWEVCHKVGGIHTVVSTKARRMAERLGDAFVMVGPWRLSAGEVPDFEPDPAFAAFADGCRAAGVPVLVGRWKIPGNPRTILVEFSGLYQRRDDILRGLWDKHRVDSLFGDWDYVEPVLFGHAAGIVIERWWREIEQGASGPAVAHFHEWMTGAGLLHLADNAPEIGTVFTAHATVLGRTLAATGADPLASLGDRTPDQAAETANVRAKHSLESAVVRKADVFTAVSEMTSDEARLFHGRAADPVVPNGWDAQVLDSLIGGVKRARAARVLRDVASRFLGEDMSDAAIVVGGGRYEFHNKGLDLTIDAAAEMNRRAGRRVVLYLFVPAGNEGLQRALVERLARPFAQGESLGVSTHTLFDADRDPIAVRCRERGLLGTPGPSRVRVIHVASYVAQDDGLFGMSYEALVQGADLSCFPSFYDAWGYTPQESLALGVPTITTDCTGFGRFMLARSVPKKHGLTVLRRRDRADDRVVSSLAATIEHHLEGPREDDKWIASCRDIAVRTEWAELVASHVQAHAKAREIARQRSRGHGASSAAAPVRPVPPRPVTPNVVAPNAAPRVFALDVAPVLPAALQPLATLVRNWSWTWDPDAHDLVASVSPETWERVGRNPVRLLREAPQADLDDRAADAAFAARVAAAVERQSAYLGHRPIESSMDGPCARNPVAYVCAEYGIHESLPIYSGGLGALAGDHLKSASDLRVPLVAVGLLYRRGYMRQRLEGGTEQTAIEERFEPGQTALEAVTDDFGQPVEVTLSLPGTSLVVRAWRADIGRVPLYLLDTDTDANRPEDRVITHSLYGGDAEMRLRQEIVLGFGGLRMLAAIGIVPACVHVNEGHGAFATLERARTLIRDSALSFDEACEVVRATTAFTTHTPVPAGHDRFGEDLIRRYFSDVHEWLKTPWERFLAIGSTPSDASGFNMTRLAVELAGRTNAVSSKHGEVSRTLLRAFCPALLEDEVPVGSVTNGVHVGGWTHREIARMLGSSGPATGADFLRRAPTLDSGRLWDARRSLRATFLEDVRVRLRRSAAERGDSQRMLGRMLDGLDENALLLGFARRFATYKRADLVLRDPARLRAILDGAGRPVRLFYAGKAHPRDTAARELLSRIAKLSRTDEFVGRIFVLENYDIALARVLVSGVDVWMNNPRAPLEASGTSGMKAACNGALNLSIGDGWWLEAFDGTNGWRIGDDAVPTSEVAQDEHDAASLLTLLEDEVVPTFFERDASGIPTAWLERVRRSMATVPPVFDTGRMVAEYAETAYRPLARRFHELRSGAFAAARSLAARRVRIEKGLASVRVVSASVVGTEEARAGGALQAFVDVALGSLTPGDVVVELVVGVRDAAGELRSPERVALVPVGPREGEAQRFEGSWTIPSTGAFAWGLRVRPHAGLDDDGPSFRDPVLWA